MRVPRAVWLLLGLGLVVGLLLAGFMSGELGTYNGLNKGVYVRVGGPVVCGVEVVGSPGVFCNDEG